MSGTVWVLKFSVLGSTYFEETQLLLQIS